VELMRGLTNRYVHALSFPIWGAGAVFVQKGIYDAFMDTSKGTTLTPHTHSHIHRIADSTQLHISSRTDALLVQEPPLSSHTSPLCSSLNTRNLVSTVCGSGGMSIELFHGYTYSGHPLAMAAGLAVLDVYQKEGKEAIHLCFYSEGGYTYVMCRRRPPLYQSHVFAAWPAVVVLCSAVRAGGVARGVLAGRRDTSPSFCYISTHHMGIGRDSSDCTSSSDQQSVD
jgi:hypothetical protein